jgi:hypothetical protein
VLGKGRKQKYLVSFENSTAKKDIQAKVVSQVRDDPAALKIHFDSNDITSDIVIQAAIVFQP